jgi:hypothetical protein
MENIIKTSLLLFSFICFSFQNVVLSQIKSPQFSIRIAAQLDFQKADFKDINFPFDFKEHKITTINFGMDLLIEKEITNEWGIYGGIGYYRNKFKFKRAYDHTLLNIGTDSIPIGTSTNDYTFALVRCPIGILYKLITRNKHAFHLGMENIVNFSFQQTYNGSKPFPNANNKYSKFQYYGNSTILFVEVSRHLNQNSFLELAPYIRMSNIYKRKDPFLFENSSNFYSRFFDAIGLSLKYSFNYKKL